MDIHELRDKSGLHITEDEYAIIREVYLNQKEIMHVYEMAEFLKANKKDYIKALIARFPGLLADLAVQTEDKKVENAKLQKENASLGCKFEKMSEENDILQTHIASMQDEIEKGSQIPIYHELTVHMIGSHVTLLFDNGYSRDEFFRKAEARIAANKPIFYEGMIKTLSCETKECMMYFNPRNILAIEVRK